MWEFSGRAIHLSLAASYITILEEKKKKEKDNNDNQNSRNEFYFFS